MATQSKNSIKALDVGHYFLHLANQENRAVTNKKLQKLVYYAQAWSLVLHKKKLFNEPIEAWVHGPAVRSLYVQYKRFGFGPIQEEVSTATVSKISDEAKGLLNEIWKVYGKLDAGYLEMLTHSEAPWQEAREGLQNYDNSENEISLKTMKDFYSGKLKEAQGQQ